MADQKDSVTLTLVLNTLGAKKEASDYVSTIDGIGSKVSQVATQMQNTVHGRLLGGLANAVSSTMGRVFNEDLPENLAEAELKIKALEASIGAAAGPKAGEFAGAIARKGFQGDINAANKTFQQVAQLQSFFPTEPLSPEALRAVAGPLYARNQQVEATSAALRRNFAASLPGNAIQLDEQAVLSAGQQALRAVAGSGIDVGKGILGAFGLRDLVGLAKGGG